MVRCSCTTIRGGAARAGRPCASRRPASVPLLLLGACLAVLALPGPSFAADPSELVQVVLTPSAGRAPATAAVRAVGGAVEIVEAGVIQALVPPDAVAALEASSAVETVDRAAVASADEVVSQGVTRIGADALHLDGLRGSGIRIAVLDMNFGPVERLDTTAGVELPPLDRQTRRSFDARYGLTGRDFIGNPSRHGAQVAEIVHDVAPEADMLLVNYHTYLEFGLAVDWLIDVAKPDVVVHSNSFLIGPFDGSGWFAQRVDRAAAAGILWVNSTGNYRERHWEGAWTDLDGDGALDLPGHGNAFALELTAASRPACSLSWTGAASGDEADAYTLGLFLDAAGRQPALDRSGQPIASAFAVEPEVRADLAPAFLPSAGTYYLRVARVGAPPPEHLTLFCRSELPVEAAVVESSVPTPGDARGALAVGAYQHRSFAPMPYSSQGPTDDGRPKPDLMGPSHVSTTGGYFGGTSAAAPHAAAAAALIWRQLAVDGSPEGTATRVADQLRSLARDVGEPGWDPVMGLGFLRLDTAAPALDVGALGPLLGAGVLRVRVPLAESGTMEHVALRLDGTPVGARWTEGAVVADIDTRLSADGSHALSLTAADRSGNEAAYHLVLAIDNTPPLLSLHMPATARVGDEVIVSGTAADAGSGLAGPPAVDFGDGTVGTGPTALHRYASPGVVTIAMEARDVAGNVARTEATLAVDAAAIPEAPALPASSDAPALQAPAAALALHVRAPLRALTGQRVAVEVVVGDERSIATYRVRLGDGREKAAAFVLHRFTRPGRYLIRADVLTPDGERGTAAVAVRIDELWLRPVPGRPTVTVHVGRPALVRLRISGRGIRRRIVRQLAAGRRPVALGSLPPGRYLVTARVRDQQVSRNIVVRKGPASR